MLARDAAESGATKLAKSAKITAFQLQRQAELKAKLESEAAQAAEMQRRKLLAQPELQPNVNDEMLAAQQRDAAQYGKGNVIAASSIDEALEKLQLESDAKTRAAGGTIDQHPERRLKAAFRAYEEEHLPILRAENPGLKYSQVKDRLWEQWQKAPENPLVQKRKAEMEAALAH